MALNRERWAVRLLNRLDIKPNRQNVKALVGWQRAEGGHYNNDARFNPLNTTQPMPGAGNTGTQGNIKVYRSPKQGLRATVKTLRNGRYDNILGALQQGSAQDVASAIGRTPWGTSSDLVSRTIADTKVGRVPKLATARSPSGGTRVTTRTVTTPGVDNSEQRRALLINYLGERGKPDALLNLATQLRQYPDIPGTKTITTETSTPQGNIKAAPEDSGDPYVAKVTRRANRIDSKRLPYLYGGGHNVKRVKIKNTGPLDCSSAVSAALGVDVRVSGQFQTFGKPGRAPGGKGITIYANPEHVLMEINGRFWGTSGSNPQGGAGWIPRSAISKDYLKRFTARHV